VSADYKILIVDDEPRNIDILKVKLEAENFEIITAIDAESAVFSFEQHLPDMVLLDVMMPGVDGREVCRALKERSGNVFIPIILVTAMTSGEDKAEGFAAGADDYITKPVDFAELSARIRNLRRLQTMAHQDRKRTIEFPSYKSGRAPLDEVFKVLADGMGVEQKTMYRVTTPDGRSAYLGIEGSRVIHARTDTGSGQEVLDDVLLWPAEHFESVAMKIIKPNLDVTFADLAKQWIGRLDIWRVFDEKLPPKRALLTANVKRASELDGGPANLVAAFKLFSEGLSVDQALRSGDSDVLATMRAIAELFYRGLLLRHGEIPAGARSLGAPLVGTLHTERPAEVPAASALHPVAVEIPDESAELAKTVEELRMEVASLNAANDSLREENVELRSSSATLEEQVAALKLQAEAPQQQPADNSEAIRKALAEKEKECLALSNQLIAASARNDMQASRVQELQTRIAQLERNGGQKVPTDILKLQGTLMEYEEELTRLRQESARQIEQIGQLEQSSRNGQAVAASSEWVEELESLRSQLRSKENEILVLNRQLEESKVVDLLMDDDGDIDPETGLAKPDESTPEVRALKGSLKQRESEIIQLREQIMAAASAHERQAFVVQELNRLLDEQKREYERRIAQLTRQ
jgi:CheY-like chemotaxis protein